MTHPIPDRFRVGDVWQSPRGKQWRVERIDVTKGALLVDAAELPNRSRQWRNEFAIGVHADNIWLRIDPPHEAPQ
jgi:hypothetical protein